MFASLLVLLALASFGATGRADTILQTNPEGQTEVVQSQAIVIRDDSYGLAYKHFNLKDRRIEIVELNLGGTPYKAVHASAAQRAQIIKVWKEFGYTASVTNDQGKTETVYDAYLDFFPPAGGIFLESVPARTNISLLLSKGGADQIDFSEISSIRVQSGALIITKVNGRTETGTLINPINQPAIAHLMGITDHYRPASDQVYDFSLPLAQIKEIRFQPCH